MENTPQIILGEANYKKWLNSVDPDNFLNRQVSYFLFCVVCVVVKVGCLLCGGRREFVPSADHSQRKKIITCSRHVSARGVDAVTILGEHRAYCYGLVLLSFL